MHDLDQFFATAEPELAIDIAEVGVDSALAQEELLRGIAIAPPLHHQFDDAQFGGGERGQGQLGVEVVGVGMDLGRARAEDPERRCAAAGSTAAQAFQLSTSSSSICPMKSTLPLARKIATRCAAQFTRRG